MKRLLVFCFLFAASGAAHAAGDASVNAANENISADQTAANTCDEKMELSMPKEETSYTGKFSFFGYTEYVFGFDGKKFVREKVEFHQPEKLSSLNYQPEISIND